MNPGHLHGFKCRKKWVGTKTDQHIYIHFCHTPFWMGIATPLFWERNLKKYFSAASLSQYIKKRRPHLNFAEQKKSEKLTIICMRPMKKGDDPDNEMNPGRLHDFSV